MKQSLKDLLERIKTMCKENTKQNGEKILIKCKTTNQNQFFK